MLRKRGVIRDDGSQCRPVGRADVEAVLRSLESINASGLVRFDGLDLSGADLRGLDLKGCSFEGCDLARVVAHPLVIIRGRELPVGDPGVNAVINRWVRCEDEQFEQEDIEVRPTCLENANLTDATLDDGDFNFVRMEGVYLTGAHVEGARFYRARLSGANIRFAHFARADVRGAHLDGADLYGADFDRCLIDDASWGEKWIVRQETEKNWEDAAHVYRMLTRAHEMAGLSNVAGAFRYRRELAQSKIILHQALTLRGSSKAGAVKSSLRLIRYTGRLVSDWTCGFGERPWRAAGAFLFVFAVMLPFYVEYTQFDPSLSGIAELLKRIGYALYFSGASTSGLGYGSWIGDELGWGKYLGVIQSILGTFFAALFLVTITRRWFR